MTESLWSWVPPAVVLALILWLTSRAIFMAWFSAKESYVDRIADKLRKLKGAGNGKG